MFPSPSISGIHKLPSKMKVGHLVSPVLLRVNNFIYNTYLKES